jgi:outer membrane protein TolC
MIAAPQSGAVQGHTRDERLAELIEEALANNPSVRQAFAEYQAALHRVPQVTALPDPSLSVTQYARSIETRAGPQERTLTVSQVFPGFGKRAAKGQIASKAAAELDERYQARRAEVSNQVKRAYFELAHVDAALDLSREDAQLLDHFEELARRRYAQGFGQQADVVRLQVRITQTLNDRETLARQRVDLEASLNSIRARPPDTPVATVRLGEFRQVHLDPGRLAETGRRHKPELRAAFRRLEAREMGIQLARRQFRPDFTAGVTWGNVRARAALPGGVALPSNGKDAYGVTVGMSLPLRRGKYDAGVRAAAESVVAAREAYRASTNVMESQIRSLSYRLQTLQRQVRLFEDTLLPQAEQAFNATREAYSNGGLEVVSLLDVQRMLLDVRLGLVRLRTDYLNAVADLELAIGAEVPARDPA